MRVGIALSATGGPWGDFVTYAQEAERLGVALCFVAEAWGTDAVSPLAYLAAKTERILLASGIIEYLVRPPFRAGIEEVGCAAATAFFLHRLQNTKYTLFMIKTFMYKLYRSKRNVRLHQQINIGGVIHNHCIALHKRYYRMYKKHLAPFRLKAHIAKLKKLPKYHWWSTLGSQAIQDIIERIDKGYQRFFQNLKDRQAHTTTRKVGPPTFRKIHNAK
jgi:hypothetical protein